MAWIAHYPASPRRSRLGGTLRFAAFVAGAVMVFGAAVAPALAINDLAGHPVPNTSVASPTAQQAGSTAVAKLFGTPFSQPRPAPVGSPNSPEEDLAQILTALGAATDVTVANTLRQRAIDILEGNAIADAAYSGIGLLNDNPIPASHKVKKVLPGGTVTVNIVRFGEHEISDTWQLDFVDPSTPFRIDYEITELGGAEGSEFAPTPMLIDGTTPIGGMHSIVTDLAIDETLLGTSQSSRFTDARGLPPAQAAEHTRLATQQIIVKMPPPKNLSVVLDPNLRVGHEALSALRPFDSAAAGPVIGIQDLAGIAPERQLWTALKPVLGAADVPAATLSTQALPLVSAMRVKSHLPPGVNADPAADVTVAFVNNEVYVSDTNLQLAASSLLLKVAVVNSDGFAHTVSAQGLKKLNPVFGATNWGEFEWEQLGAPTSLAAGTTQTFTYSPSSNAFQLVIGDPTSGDQARAAITLDRGPIQESFRVPGPAFSMPLHEAFDANGDIWLTLAGADKIAKLTPATRLADSTYVEYQLPVPPGTPPGAAVGVFEPLDITVDPQGIVWATLPVANAIARLDPALARPGTSNGIEIIPLADCPNTECRTPPPPLVPGLPLSREPTQMDLRRGADGGTEIWFTELFADKIGVVKWLGPGSHAEQHFTCACKVPSLGAGVAAGTPLGIDVDDTGLVWFTAANKNTIGRITPGADPFASTVIQTDHFTIPSGVTVTEPDIGGMFTTSIPHSVAVGPDGKVWFTEQAMRQVGWLDPTQASPGTTQGMHEILIGDNAFGARTQPADLVVDPAGTVFVTDEYGDQITALTPSGIKDRWRPTERVSLTDQPLTDRSGNLWFLEAGANLITRITGVAATQRSLSASSSAGSTSPATTQGTVPANPVKAACVAKFWSFGTKAKPRVFLLGNTAVQVTACLGKPTLKNGKVWTYGRRLRVTFKAGTVVQFTILNNAFRTKTGNIGVGSPVTALAKLSTAKVTHDKKGGGYTTVLSLGAKRGAQVRFAVANKKITNIIVTLVKTAK